MLDKTFCCCCNTLQLSQNNDSTVFIFKCILLTITADFKYVRPFYKTFLIHISVLLMIETTGITARLVMERITIVRKNCPCAFLSLDRENIIFNILSCNWKWFMMANYCLLTRTNGKLINVLRKWSKIP